MAETPRTARKEEPAAADDTWLVREIVGEFVFAPLVRGGLWLVLQVAFLVKRLLTP